MSNQTVIATLNVQMEIAQGRGYASWNQYVNDVGTDYAREMLNEALSVNAR